MKLTLFQQEIHRIPFKSSYWPELASIEFKLKDSEGNKLALYKCDYIRLLKHLEAEKIKIEQLTNEELIDQIKKYNTHIPKDNPIQIIKYFSEKNLEPLKLSSASNFSSESFPCTVGGMPLIKEGHQNCVIMDKQGEIFMHPKVRGNLAENRFGVNHSSLPFPKKSVAFAGSFVHNGDKWQLENTTGHYGTRITQVRNFLEFLKKTGVSGLEKLEVKLWIPNNPDKPGAKEEDYTILYENAMEFLSRTSKSIAKIDDRAKTHLALSM